MTRALDVLTRERLAQEAFVKALHLKDQTEEPHQVHLRREELITKLCDNLAESVDMDTLIACFYEDQYRYFDKEADSSELLEWLVSTETITEEEANELEKNGF